MIFVSFVSHTKGATSGAGNDYPSGTRVYPLFMVRFCEVVWLVFLSKFVLVLVLSVLLRFTASVPVWDLQYCLERS